MGLAAPCQARVAALGHDRGTRFSANADYGGDFLHIGRAHDHRHPTAPVIPPRLALQGNFIRVSRIALEAHCRLNPVQDGIRHCIWSFSV